MIPTSRSGQYLRVLFYWRRHFSKTLRDPIPGQRRFVEKLWREFFADPSQWWDHRPEKVNARFPDFKHKETHRSLWVDSNLNPTWVKSELAGVAPGTLQLSTFSWNMRLARCVNTGEHEKTLQIFKQMQREGIHPNSFSFVPALAACCSLRALEEGRRIHEQVISNNFEADAYVCSSLVVMYAKCGRIEDAMRVFNKMPTHDVVSWSAIILGHVKCGQGKKALELSRQMLGEGVEPNPVTFLGILNACASVGALEEGRYVHQQIIQRGYESDLKVGSCLVDMYAKCGDVDEARKVFNKMPSPDLVSWNAMILGYVKCGQYQKALEISHKMQVQGLEPNAVTFVGMVNACAGAGAIEEGTRLHQHIVHRGYASDVYVGSSLVDMYAKCGSIEDARRVFDKIPTRNVVTWNTIILGYVRSGDGQKALDLFKQMKGEGVDPDSVTFVGVLNACASMAALEEGRHLHQQILQSDFHFDEFVGNSLIDMYAKCGSVDDSWRVFNEMPTRSIISWNAILGAYAMHGHTSMAFGKFEQMQKENVEMDGVTFLSLLSACSHGGLVDEGLHYFEFMRSMYCTSATIEHFTCMVDLLGRAGRLHEAGNLIETMCDEPSLAVWRCLLGACRVYGNLNIGEHVAKRVLELEPENDGGYLLLSNIYAAAGK